MFYQNTPMNFNPMLGPGGTRQIIGPGGTQQLIGPGGTQQPTQPQQMNLPPGSPYSENTGYPTAPPSSMNVNPMLGPGGTQQHLLGPGGTQQSQMNMGGNGQQSIMAQNPYARLMQLWMGMFPQANQNNAAASGNTPSSFMPSNGASTNYLSMAQNPQMMQLLQHLFSGGSF